MRILSLAETARSPHMRTYMSRQLTLNLPTDIGTMGRGSFLTTPANEPNLALLDAWARSSEQLLVICGAASAGKTHLASILAHERPAQWLATITTAALGREPAYAGSAEDTGHDEAHDLLTILDPVAEATPPRTLLEFVERLREGRRPLVLVGRGTPIEWAQGLRDLETRLEAAPRIDVSPPDEELLRGVIAKRFKDRQLDVDRKLIEYVAPRLKRTLAAANDFVEAADAAALASKSPISVPLARKVLADLS
ncbi:MAG: hypothetical protein AAFY84_15200 [Pseudomonadota bacterium]